MTDSHALRSTAWRLKCFSVFVLPIGVVVLSFLFFVLGCMALPEGRDLLSTPVSFVSRWALPGDFDLMSMPVCGGARRTEDKTVSFVFRRTLLEV